MPEGPVSADDHLEDGLTEEWDIAIARALMRNTWANAIGAVALGVLSLGTCCNPVGLVATVLSLGAALNTGLRLVSMSDEYKQQVPAGERVGVMIVAAVGGLVSLVGPLVWIVGIVFG